MPMKAANAAAAPPSAMRRVGVMGGNGNAGRPPVQSRSFPDVTRHLIRALLALAPAAAFAQSARPVTLDSLGTRGVSHQLARYRATRISDVRYDLNLDVTRKD